MKNQNRVLIRRGARELDPAEANQVQGGFVTLSLCTADPVTKASDGDRHVGELGC